MATVVISPPNVVTFPEGGGHFWVYMQYAQGLLREGCEVYWLECFVSSGDRNRDAHMLSQFLQRMDHFGLSRKVLLYSVEDSGTPAGSTYEFIGWENAVAEKILQRADLLLNFYYAMEPGLLSRFRRTALVDIDPGLLQLWISTGLLAVSPHDVYFSIGETVGMPAALFPDCGLHWMQIQPPVCLDLWPYVYDANCRVFTTISSWYGGGGKGEFITDGQGVMHENNKRVTYLQYVRLPRLTSQPLELALNLGDGDPDNVREQNNNEKGAAKEPYAGGLTDHISDAVDRKRLVDHGWRIRHSYEVAGSPESYRSYIQRSRGEYSCAKPFYVRLQTAWISDRTICYLASGKPVVVQDTGPSRFLPNGAGMFRFSTLEEAVGALATVNSDYRRHCRLARELAETHFDARRVVNTILHSCRL